MIVTRHSCIIFFNALLKEKDLRIETLVFCLFVFFAADRLFIR